MNTSSAELFADFLRTRNKLKLCTLYTAIVNDACVSPVPQQRVELGTHSSWGERSTTELKAPVVDTYMQCRLLHEQ